MIVICSMRFHHGLMDLQQMRYAVALAEERSFTRAAARCFVVQSALSHQIKALEREIAVPLFARTSRRVELTAAGEVFVAHAREALQAADRAAVEAAAANGCVTGSVTIGLIPTVTAVDLPDALATFHAAHPEVRVRLRVGESAQFITEIKEGRLDLAFLGLPEDSPPQGVACRALSDEALVAVLPSRHPLARRRRVRLAELADEEFVDFPRGSSGRAQSDRAFDRLGLHREVAFEAVTADLILGLVRAGLAIGLVPAHIVPQGQGVVAVPVKDGPRRVQYVAWNRLNPTPAARAVLAVVDPDQHAPAQYAVDQSPPTDSPTPGAA